MEMSAMGESLTRTSGAAARRPAFSRSTSGLQSSRRKTLRPVPLRRAGSDSAAASAYLSYGEQPDESWYLFPGAASLHWRSAENSLDDAALETAGRLLEIR